MGIYVNRCRMEKYTGIGSSRKSSMGNLIGLSVMFN